MRIVAFDLSLVRTGVAGTHSYVLNMAVHRGLDRLRRLRNRVLEITEDAALVVLEGYSHGHARNASSIVQLSELGGVVRLALFEAGIPFVDVAPASLKKYATGKGNAKKEEVLAAAIRRLGYASHDHNEADALWLRAMALDHYDLPGAVQMPAKNREALAAVQWPKLSGNGAG